MAGGTQVSTSSTEPWKQQKKFLGKGFKRAEDIMKEGPPKWYGHKASAEDVTSGKAGKVGDWVYGETLAGFTPAQKQAQQMTYDYTTGDRAKAMQAGSESQLLGTYDLSKNLAQGAVDYGTSAADYGQEGYDIGIAGQAAVDPLAETTMTYGKGLTDTLGQDKYAGLTPFEKTQYEDLMSGKVQTGADSPYAAMESALSQGVMSNLQSNILPGLRQQQLQYQPGGSSRGQLEQNAAITEAVQSGLTQPLAEMYGGAYQQAQQMRLPAAQMGIGQQQFGMGHGLAGGQLSLQGTQAAQQGVSAANQGIGTALAANQAAQGAGQMGLSALSQYPSTMQAPLSMFKATGDVGAQQRALQQEQINQAMQRYQYNATKDQAALGNYMNTVQGNYGGTTTQTTPGASGMQNMSSIVGMLGTLGSLSDVRVKENIEKVGEYDGMGVYDFNYKWTPERRRGLMAQEVEQVKPEAVFEVGGIKAIDYGKI